MQADKHFETHLFVDVDVGQVDGARVRPRPGDAGSDGCRIGLKDDSDQRYLA